ncbi:SPP1 [Scenedesmus sp. PABB004]|nr:SPP1 [Scenedesmus sp. PABB004]
MLRASPGLPRASARPGPRLAPRLGGPGRRVACWATRDPVAGLPLRLPPGAAPPQQIPSPEPGKAVALHGGRKKYVPFTTDFYCSAPVQLAGSWNDWMHNIDLPTDPASGEAGIVLELDGGHGELSYKFNVDGKWHLSRADAAVADSQGCVNNSTSGRKLVRFSFPAAFAGPRGAEEQVHLIGSFTAWQVVIPMALAADGAYHCDVALPPGHHTFRFLVNAAVSDPRVYAPMSGLVAPARYAVLAHLPVEVLPGGVQVNSLRVPPPPTFKLLYHTQFSEAHLFYAFKGSPEPVRRLRMHHAPGCSGLMVAQLHAPTPDAVLEFSIVGASWEGSSSLSTISTLDEEVGFGSMPGAVVAGGERDPPGTRHYTAARPGVWRLKHGSLRLDDASQIPPLMLCTDLDGTLIEDQAETNDWVRQADELTWLAGQHFGQYLAPAGGVLVFNTGRSIGMVEGLLAKKGPIMPWPTAIITAVGTKVFLYDVATRAWVPDTAYARLLDDGWNLGTVQAVASKLMQRFQDRASMIDDGSEHPHRVSLQIRSDVLGEFMDRWAAGLAEAGVAAQFISSIGGEWRYVDCISAHAGKGRAMAYLAARYGIALEDAVAAGDSGNDLLMLAALPEGPHPAIVMSNSHPEVWDWLARCTPEERAWIYTPKAERGAGLVEGLKAIVADKLAAAAQRAAAAAATRALQPPALRAPPAAAATRALRA